MKIIDAVWENKNLGVKTIELIYNFEDNNCTSNLLLEYYYNAIKLYKPSYIVAKIPIKCRNLLNLISDLNFCFIETQLELSLHTNNFNYNNFKFYKKHLDCNCIISNKIDDYNNVIANIKDDTFYTDRIAIDDRFGIEISNKRYKNWINDLKIDNSILLLTNKKDINYGFHIGEIIDNTFFGRIGGIYKTYQKEMLGGFWAYTMIDCLIDKCNKIVNPVSSNNINVIKLWQNFGFIIEDLNYVFIKHI